MNHRGNAGLGERDIRDALRAWLLQTAETGAAVREELSVGGARVDVARIGSRLEGFEIKSDFDNLSRLPRQVEAFSAVFDSMTLVVGERLICGALSSVPRWWGLQVASDTASGEVRLRVVRAGSQNPAQSVDALAQMLWHAEAVEALELLSDIAPRKRWTSRQLHERISTGVPVEQLRRFVIDRLRDPYRLDDWIEHEIKSSGAPRRRTSFSRSADPVPAAMWRALLG
jgi:hypothetical protein